MNLPPEEWLAAYCLGWTQGEVLEARARFEAVRAVIVEGLSVRAAAKRHALDARTVRKMIAGLSSGCVGARGGMFMVDSSAPLGQGEDSGAVHGLRCAPPVATGRGPFGAGGEGEGEGEREDESEDERPLRLEDSAPPPLSGGGSGRAEVVR